MLTVEENEILTRVGPGTPMGDLMRWYWHPIAALSQLDQNPVMKVRLLGEDLVLFKDRTGRLGLIADRCAHRRVNLVFGIPESDGLRCPYHGWLYDTTGQCTEMPSEPADSTFPSRVKLTSYLVEELGGMVFAYMGPAPAPLLPRWDLLVEQNVLRDIGIQVVPCNWLQMQENDLDPAHLQWLHGYFSNYALERLGRPDLMRRREEPMARVAIGDRRDWQVYSQGIMNYDRTPNGLREVRPSLFPNMNSFSTEFMYRVPIDDTHTLHVFYTAYPQPEGESTHQDSIPFYLIPASVDGEGLPIWPELDSNGGQDTMAWVAQGDIVDRTQEKLGESDRGIILWRELLRRQLKIVADGGEPMNVFRDPAQNVRIDVPPRNGATLEWTGPNNIYTRRVNGPYKHSVVVRDLVEKYIGAEALIGPVH